MANYGTCILSYFLGFLFFLGLYYCISTNPFFVVFCIIGASLCTMFIFAYLFAYLHDIFTGVNHYNVYRAKSLLFFQILFLVAVFIILMYLQLTSSKANHLHKSNLSNEEASALVQVSNSKRPLIYT